MHKAVKNFVIEKKRKKIWRETFAYIFIGTLISLTFLFLPPAFGAGEDDDIENYQNQLQEQNNNINEKIKKELENKGIKLDDPAAATNIMQQIQNTSGAGEESASSGLYWFFMIFISIVGMGFFAAGKRNEDAYFMISGAIMMIYPYFITSAILLAATGILLIIAPFVLKFYSTNGN